MEITNADVQQQLSEFISLMDPININNYWAGITDKAREGTFRLASSNEVIGYTNWGPGEPSQDGDEVCVQFQQVTHTWNDNTCTNFFFAICQTIQK